MKKISLFYLLVLILSTHSNAQDTLKTFIFGHSLINHENQINITPSQETSVPHWFHFLAEEAGYNYAVSGQYGFIPQHANLPPTAQWWFDSLAPAWDSNSQPFAQADFDNILITPANFIQYQGPTENYYNDNQSPIDYSNQIFDWLKLQEDSLNFYIYENWPDMASFLSNGFPPTQSEWMTYNNYLNGDFHNWFLEYHDSLILAHPNHCVRMIPTGPVISDLLMQAPYNQIAIDTLYEDDAPHGRPTIYFLAALTTYMAMYHEPAPSTFQVPSIIDPIIANNYQQVVDFIWNSLMNFNLSSGESRVFCQSIPSSINEIELADITLYPNPTSGKLTLDSNLDIQEVELYDSFGRSVLKVNNNSFNISDLNAGTYLCTITLATGQRLTKKVFKL